MEQKEEIKPLAVYSSEQAANLLGLSIDSIQRYAKSGRLKATILGKKYLITGQAILNFLEENTKA